MLINEDSTYNGFNIRNLFQLWEDSPIWNNILTYNDLSPSDKMDLDPVKTLMKISRFLFYEVSGETYFKSYEEYEKLSNQEYQNECKRV